MSGPTKGMVAGKPITTGDLTKEYEDNHSRIFGDRKPARGRWVWDADAGQMVEASAYREKPVEGRLQISMDRHYENTATVDGVDIGSRRKRETYMKDHGLADPRDFKGEWKGAEERKAANLKEGLDRRAVREISDTVGRKAYELSKKRRR